MGFLSGLFGGGSDKAAKEYARKVEFKPYDLNLPYGSIDFDRKAGTVGGMLSPQQAALQQYFMGTGAGLLGNFTNQLGSGGISPQMAQFWNQCDRQVPGMPQNNTSFGGFLNPLGAAFRDQIGSTFGQNLGQSQHYNFAKASNGFLKQLGSFDPSQLASDYTSNLRDQAMPENQRAVDSTMQGLFNRGRLGSTGGANVLGRLAEAQNMQDLQFQKAGMDYAGQEQNRMAGLAGSLGTQGGFLGQLGSQMESQAIGNAMGLAGQYGNFDQLGFSNNMALNGLQDSRANQRFSNAMQMFGVGNQNLAAGLGAASLGQGLFGQAQGIDDRLLSLIQTGGSLGSQQSSANAAAWGPWMQAKQQQSDFLGNLTSAFIGKALFPKG